MHKTHRSTAMRHPTPALNVLFPFHKILPFALKLRIFIHIHCHAGDAHSVNTDSQIEFSPSERRRHIVAHFKSTSLWSLSGLLATASIQAAYPPVLVSSSTGLESRWNSTLTNGLESGFFYLPRGIDKCLQTNERLLETRYCDWWQPY